MGEGDFTYLAIARQRPRNRHGALASVLAIAQPMGSA